MTKYSIQARIEVEDNELSTKLSALESSGLIIASIVPVRALQRPTAPVAA